MKVEDRVLRSVRLRKGNVILRSEVAGMASPSQVSEALRALQERGVLVKIGTGVYARTRRSTVTGAIIPAGSLETLACEALARMGVKVSAAKLAAEYNARKTTQLPGAFVANTGHRRITRKIAVGGRTVLYENDYGRTKASA